MAHETTQRTANSETTRRVLVDNTHDLLFRQMSWGNSWNHLRLFMKLATTRATAWDPAPKFYFGVSAGTSLAPTAASNFVGIGNSDTGWGLFSIMQFAQGGSSQRVAGYRVQNGVQTKTPFTTSGNYLALPAGATGGCGVWCLDLLRSGGNINLNMYQYGFGSTRNQTQFLDIVNSGELTSLQLVGGQIVFAVDEVTYGDLDSAGFYFDSALHPFEVDDFIPVRLS